MIFIFFLSIGLASAFAVPHGNIPHPRFMETQSSDPWNQFKFSVDLDVSGKYWMFWTPDDETETITFEVHVEALGYVGFGISPNGGMTGADVVIGWVSDNGTAVFHDRHALGEYEPIIDKSQDVTLLSSSQNDTHTILRFSRPYVTCDENDRDITTDTIRVIFSFTDTDPEDITGLQYHGETNRGSKSVTLLSYEEEDQTLPEDTITMDFLVTEIEVPQRRTTYWCEFMKVPQLEQKHHVVMFEPVIQPGNEGLVHHIVLHACYGDMDNNSHGVAWDCMNNIMPGQENCYTATAIWAVGGNAFYFPEHVGLPFSSPEDMTPLFMRIEMHYDNPSHLEGVRDHSGMRLHMTPTLRQYDAGTLVLGSDVGPFMLIPPHFDSLTYRGHCMPQCLQHGIDDTDDTPDNNVMNVFAGYQHAHVLGSKINTRLFRDGAELEPLINEQNYDFNYQDTRMFKEERVIYPNDMMLVDCVYDSSNKKTITVGGLATKDEMCISYLLYYPRNNVIACNSNPPEYQSVQVVDGLEFVRTDDYPYFRITGPQEYENMTTLEVLQTLDWTDETIRNKYQELLLETNADMQYTCLIGNEPEPQRWLKSPELGTEWIDPNDGQCDSSSHRCLSSLFLFTVLTLCRCLNQILNFM